MKRFIATLLLGASLTGSCGYATAADLAIAPVVDAPPVQPSIYVQLLGGFTAALDVDYYLDVDTPLSLETDHGFVGPRRLGVVVMDGLSLEADVMYAKRGYTDPYPDDTSASISLMGNVKYTAALNDQFSAYGAVGVGFIKLGEYGAADDKTYDFEGAGYQFILGASMEVAQNTSLVTEVRYQNTFQPSDYTGDDGYPYTVQAPTASALVGLKFGF